MRKRAFIWCGKVMLAGVLAWLLLTLFCLFYNNKPVFLECEDGVTDSKYEPNTFYCRMIEGLSYGKTNNDGYINLQDYDREEQISVLLMGASHMEAMEVPQRLCTASLLDALLPEETVYNVGITGHYLPICASNLASAVQKYSPSKFVIIDTGSIVFTREELTEYLQDIQRPSNVNTGRLYMLLRRNQYIHLVVNQLQKFHLIGQDEEVEHEEKPLEDIELLSQALRKMSETVASGGGG